MKINRKSKAKYILILFALFSFLNVSFCIKSLKVYTSNNFKNKKIKINKSNKEVTEVALKSSLFLENAKKIKSTKSPNKKTNLEPAEKEKGIIASILAIVRNVYDYCVEKFTKVWGVISKEVNGLIATIKLFSFSKFVLNIIWGKIIKNIDHIDSYISYFSNQINSAFSVVTSTITGWFSNDTLKNSSLGSIFKSENLIKDGFETVIRIADECMRPSKPNPLSNNFPLRLDSSKFKIEKLYSKDSFASFSNKSESSLNVIEGFIEKMLYSMLPFSIPDLIDASPPEILAIELIGIQKIVEASAKKCSSEHFYTFRDLFNKIIEVLDSKMDTFELLISILNLPFANDINFKSSLGFMAPPQGYDVGKHLNEALSYAKDIKSINIVFFDALIHCYADGIDIFKPLPTGIKELAFKGLEKLVNLVLSATLPVVSQVRGLFYAGVSIFESWRIFSFRAKTAAKHQKDEFILKEFNLSPKSNLSYKITDKLDQINKEFGDVNNKIDSVMATLSKVSEKIASINQNVINEAKGTNDKIIITPVISLENQNNLFNQYGKYVANFGFSLVRAYKAIIDLESYKTILNEAVAVGNIILKLFDKELFNLGKIVNLDGKVVDTSFEEKMNKLRKNTSKNTSKLFPNTPHESLSKTLNSNIHIHKKKRFA